MPKLKISEGVKVMISKRLKENGTHKMLAKGILLIGGVNCLTNMWDIEHELCYFKYIFSYKLVGYSKVESLADKKAMEHKEIVMN